MSKEILDAVSELSTEVKGNHKSTEQKLQEQKEAADKQIKEAHEAAEKKITEVEKLSKEAIDKLKAEVDQLNEDGKKKGKTLGEIAEDIKDIKAGAGRFAGGGAEAKSTVSYLQEALKEHAEAIVKVSKGKGFGFELKTVGNMTAANNLTGSVIATYSQTPAIRGFRQINIRDLLQVIASATGTWKFYRQNSTVGEGSVDFQTTHGNAKNQVDYDLTEVTIVADFLAAFSRISKQMLQDLPFVQSFVAGQLVEDYKRAESQAFINQLFSAATTFSPTGSNYAEKLIYTIADLMSKDYAVNGIVTSAAKWAEILVTKPNDYSIPGGVTISAEGVPLFAGVPVIVQNNVTGNQTVVGDFTRAAIIQAEGLSVNFFEQDSDNVQKNLITARVEARVALAVLRPDAFDRF